MMELIDRQDVLDWLEKEWDGMVVSLFDGIKALPSARPDLQPTCNQLATDCISRQAAIDALEKVAELFPWRVPGKRDTYDSYNEAWNDAIGRAEMEIENLPSAQPELPIKEKCCYCPHCTNCDVNDDLTINQPEPQWIPCSDKLPEEYGEYRITWTTSASKSRFIGDSEYEITGEWDSENYRFKGEWLLPDYIKAYPSVKVLAWHELEEPWRGEEHDDC